MRPCITGLVNFSEIAHTNILSPWVGKMETPALWHATLNNDFSHSFNPCSTDSNPNLVCPLFGPFSLQGARCDN